MDEQSAMNDSMTLDPPGSVAVIGAGPIGVEAALYGRFLGYDVTLFESVAVGHSMSHHGDESFPMMPDRCMSPLALAALRAQQRDNILDPSPPHAAAESKMLPMTYRQWIHEALIPLTETDLLRGRLRVPVSVTEIATVPVQSDDEDEGSDEIPADFRLSVADSGGQKESIDFEAVILAVGSQCDITLRFETPTAYFHRIGATPSGDPEKDLATGLREIVRVFAELAGRADLDLYRPRRV